MDESREISIVYADTNHPVIKFKGIWRRVDLDNLHRILLRELPIYLKGIKESNKCQNQPAKQDK